MRTRRRLLLVPVIGLVAAISMGCGNAASSGSAAPVTPTAAVTPAPTVLPTDPPIVPQPTPIADAPASGVLLQLTGAGLRWTPEALEGPAGKTFQVELENGDEYQHDIAVYTLPNGEEPIFKTEFVDMLQTATLDLPGLPAGTYEFICSRHTSTMRGTLTIQ